MLGYQIISTINQRTSDHSTPRSSKKKGISNKNASIKSNCPDHLPGSYCSFLTFYYAGGSGETLALLVGVEGAAGTCGGSGLLRWASAACCWCGWLPLSCRGETTRFAKYPVDRKKLHKMFTCTK